jgi:hypothetical protein
MLNVIGVGANGRSPLQKSEYISPQSGLSPDESVNYGLFFQSRQLLQLTEQKNVKCYLHRGERPFASTKIEINYDLRQD